MAAAVGLATAGFAGAAFGFAATLTGALGLGAAFFWTTGLLASFLAGFGATFFAGLSAGEDFTTFFTTGFFLGTTFFAGFLLPAALPLFFVERIIAWNYGTVIDLAYQRRVVFAAIWINQQP